jgi:two-component system response regulator
MNANRGRVILNVDDDPNDRFFFERAFKRAGLPHRLVVLGDGEAAINYLKGEGPRSGETRPLPSLVFLDLKMPKLSGFDVLSWMGQMGMFESVKVVVLSSSNMERDMETASRMGACAYCMKPPIEQLSALIRECCAKWLADEDCGGSGK